jgi:hypothetical protein
MNYLLLGLAILPKKKTNKERKTREDKHQMGCSAAR